MCEPVSMTTAMVAMSVATTAVTAVAQSEQANAERRTINAQAAIKGQQERAQAGQELEQTSMRARAERAASAAAASGAGINLGSNSFMSSLQTTTMNQANEAGLITENEQNQQQATVAETQSLLNSKASSPTFLGATLDTALAGGDAYMKGTSMYKLGTMRPYPNAAYGS